MHRPDEERARLEAIELLLHQERVGAEIDELLARDDALDHLLDLAVEERLAAGDRHHRRAALVDRLEALLDPEALVPDGVGVVYFAAAGPGQVAAEQRLEAEAERVALAAPEPPLCAIGACAD